MKLRQWVILGLVLVGGYVTLHWLFAHGGMALIKGNVGSMSASAGAGIGR